MFEQVYRIFKAEKYNCLLETYSWPLKNLLETYSIENIILQFGDYKKIKGRQTIDKYLFLWEYLVFS